jgi:hypothetical protein
MDTFLWNRHKVETLYPDSTVRAQFGNSYQFAAPPDSPDQRIFKLYFTGFKYFVQSDGVSVDLTTSEYINNVGALEVFYQSKRLYGTFIYPHPAIGNVTVRFSKPLQIPKGVASGNGLVEDFIVELIELP